jgi:hypothetical protein
MKNWFKRKKAALIKYDNEAESLILKALTDDPEGWYYGRAMLGGLDLTHRPTGTVLYVDEDAQHVTFFDCRIPDPKMARAIAQAATNLVAAREAEAKSEREAKARDRVKRAFN